MAEVRPTRGLVQQGYTIVRRGDEVTPAVHNALTSLTLAQRERAGDIAVYRALLGQVLLVVAALGVFFLYLYLLRRHIFDDLRAMLLVGLLFGATLLAFGLAARSGLVDDLAVPVALVSILLTVLFDSRVGMIGTLTLAVLGGLIYGYDFEFAYATLCAGFVAVFSVRDVKNRSQLLFSAGLVLTAYFAIIVGFALLRAEPLGARLASEGLSVVVNASLLLLAAPLLYGIERGFGFTTDLTLLELSDTNRPLLKELSLRAPGTFNHALQVANLAEAAADVIGANALRARVGALYHDIGKMLKPEYYVENQRPGENPHDRITPHMSALVIAEHVRNGVEMGREHRLPRVILDFIPAHHGTGLMEYFFARAKEQAEAGGPSVEEAEFRYPGPRPATAEQAIVMLADTVEAASRSLQKPTPRRLETLIDGLFRSRLDDGQLSLAPITLADLSRVRDTFLSILSGVYHFRVKYPGQDAEDESDDAADSVEPKDDPGASTPESEGVPAPAAGGVGTGS
jgi:putative nucleotidyltransferase with HDIG domain